MAQNKPGMTPKQRRTVLATLSRDRLAELTEQYYLDIEDRLVKDGHIEE